MLAPSTQVKVYSPPTILVLLFLVTVMVVPLGAIVAAVPEAVVKVGAVTTSAVAPVPPVRVIHVPRNFTQLFWLGVAFSVEEANDSFL